MTFTVAKIPQVMSVRTCGIVGMILIAENWNIRRKISLSATLSAINPHGLAYVRTLLSTVRGRRLSAFISRTSFVMARHSRSKGLCNAGAHCHLCRENERWQVDTTAWGERSGAVGCGTALQAGTSRARVPTCSLASFGRTMTLGSAQPLTEPGVFSGGGGKACPCVGQQPYHLHVPIVKKFWEPQTPAALKACARLSYLLSSWGRVFMGKLTGSELVKKFLATYGTRKFITSFTSARQLSLSWEQG